MMKNLKISVVEPVGGHGGMNYYDIGLCTGLGKNGVDVTLYTCDINPPKSVNGLFKVKSSFRGIYGNASKWLRGLRYIRGLISSLVVDRIGGAKLVHFHFFYVGPIEYISILFARSLHYKVVITAHDVESFDKNLTIQSLVKRTYAMAHAVIAHNRSSSAEVVEKLQVEQDRVHIVPHGSYVDFVDMSLTCADARTQIGISPATEHVILFFGQIKEVKGLDILIKAFSEICTEYPKATLVIAGRVWKDDFDKYNQLIVDSGIQDQTKLYIRYISDDEVKAFYLAADVVVLPYRRIYQSGVLLMAMSYGVPVIASDLDAMKEVVVDEKNGYLFRSESHFDLTCKLRHVLDHSVERNAVSTRAYLDMNADYGWFSIGEKVSSIYRFLCR